MICKKCGQENPPDTVYCINCGSPLTRDVIPRPGVGSSLSYGWRIMWKHFWGLFLSIFVLNIFYAAIVFVSWIVYYRLTNDLFYWRMVWIRFDPDRWPWEFEVIVIGISVLLSTPLVFGIFSLCLGLVRGENIKFNRLLDAFRNYPSVLLVSAVYSLVIFAVYFFLAWLTSEISGLGIFLFIVWTVAFLIIMCRLVFVPFLITEGKMKRFTSISTSWIMSSGHAGKAFGIAVVLMLIGVVVWVIFFILSLTVGTEYVIDYYILLVVILLLEIPLNIWLISAFTSLYYSVFFHDKNRDLKDNNDSTYQLG
jgi:hypothetical protein